MYAAQAVEKRKRLTPEEMKALMARHTLALRAIRGGVAPTEGDRLDLLLMVVTGVPLDEMGQVPERQKHAPPPGPRPPEGMASRLSSPRSRMRPRADGRKLTRTL